jgi:hypothetical protein
MSEQQAPLVSVLPHQAKRLAGLDIKAHAINRLHGHAFTQQTAVERRFRHE